jgi:hypothetical protein
MRHSRLNSFTSSSGDAKSRVHIGVEASGALFQDIYKELYVHGPLIWKLNLTQQIDDAL